MQRKKATSTTNSLEKSKEMLVLAYFLFTDNRWASADRIVEYWSPKGTGTTEKVLPKGVGPGDRSLSRAGAAKICRRLVDVGLLVKKERRGYRGKIVHEYQLPTSHDFLIVAERLKKTYPVLALQCDYGQNWLRNFALPSVCRVLRIDLDPWKKDVEWVIVRSPTAFAIITDDSLQDGFIAGLETAKERTSVFLETLACAIKVDMTTGAKGLLLDDAEAIEVARRLRTAIADMPRLKNRKNTPSSSVSSARRLPAKKG